MLLDTAPRTLSPIPTRLGSAGLRFARSLVTVSTIALLFAAPPFSEGQSVEGTPQNANVSKPIAPDPNAQNPRAFRPQAADAADGPAEPTSEEQQRSRPATRNEPPAEPSADETPASKPALRPISVDDGVHRYRWLIDDAVVGHSTARIRTESDRLTLRFDWRQSYNDNNFSTDSTSVYDTVTGQPIEFEQKLIFGTMSRGIERMLAAEFRETGLVGVEVRQGEVAWADETATPNNAQLYMSQSFENVLWLAALHHARRDIESYELIGAGSDSITTQTAKVVEQAAKGDATDLRTKYRFEYPGVEASWWVAKDGMLDEYRQGRLRIERIGSPSMTEEGVSEERDGTADGSSSTTRPRNPN